MNEEIQMRDGNCSNKTRYAIQISYSIWRFSYFCMAKDMTYDEIDKAVRSGKIIPGSNPPEDKKEKGGG